MPPSRAAWILLAAQIALGQVAPAVRGAVTFQQLDLADAGIALLLKEAAASQLFLLGELHGENEIPALIRAIWPAMWKSGYRGVAAEISPWMANRLEFGNSNLPPLPGLWTRAEAAFVTGYRERGDPAPVLWGCDMEEIRPDLLIADLAATNPDNAALQRAVSATSSGYRRSMAPDLLGLLPQAAGIKNPFVGGYPLLRSIRESLEIDVLRAGRDRLAASERRESLMKQMFHDHWLTGVRPKVLLRFGRNHLHRGYDRRGVSTLGNFAAEIALANQSKSFHLAVFAGGGKVRLGDQLIDWDERSEDPAFEFLASQARFPATVFDLRPARLALHRIPEGKRTAAEASLTYWADSYDAILYYREVTPVAPVP